MKNKNQGHNEFISGIFLDRDGVINEDIGYLSKWKDFKFREGVIEALKILKNTNYKLIIITNQSGIARGYYSEKDYQDLTMRMVSYLKHLDIVFDGIYHCPHHPDFDIKCECRKPSPGMILKSAKKLNISLSSSIMIGDKLTDIQAGINAGIKKLYYIKSSVYDEDLKKIRNVHYVNSLLECTNYILNDYSKDFMRVE